MEKSIYQLICDHITAEGVLPDNFSLPDKDRDGTSIQWAPGALDGVFLYHIGHEGLSASQTKQMARALKSAASVNYTETDKLFAEWTREVRFISVADDLQNYVLSHTESLSAEQIYESALSLVLHSEHPECVKVGMALLELIKSDSDAAIREIIRRLGLCDEFTIFTLWHMQKWENGNQKIFELAKKVHGWGRIHAVELLEPETDEIRHWLLTDGTVNSVMNSYSSLICWQKSQAEAVLFGQTDREGYQGLSRLIGGLLDEGAVPGISELENREEVLLRFLALSAGFDLTPDEREVIRSIKFWADQETSPAPAISAACSSLLDFPEAQ